MKSIFELTDKEAEQEYQRLMDNQKGAMLVFGVTVFIYIFFTIGTFWYIAS